MMEDCQGERLSTGETISEPASGQNEENSGDITIAKPWEFGIPDWFLERNVKWPSELKASGDSVELIESIPATNEEPSNQDDQAPLPGTPTTDPANSTSKVLQHEYDELCDTVTSALMINRTGNLHPAQSAVILRGDKDQSVLAVDALVARLCKDIGASLTFFDLADLQELVVDLESQIQERVRMKLPCPEADPFYTLPILMDISYLDYRIFHYYGILSCNGPYKASWSEKGIEHPVPKPVTAILEASPLKYHISTKDKAGTTDGNTKPRMSIIYIRDADRILNLGQRCSKKVQNEIIKNINEVVQARRNDGVRVLLLVSVLSGTCLACKNMKDPFDLFAIFPDLQHKNNPSLVDDLRDTLEIENESIVTITSLGPKGTVKELQELRRFYARSIRCTISHSVSQEILTNSTDLICAFPEHDFADDPQVISILDENFSSVQNVSRVARLLCGRLARHLILTIDDLRQVLRIVHGKPLGAKDGVPEKDTADEDPLVKEQAAAREKFRLKLADLRPTCNKYEEDLIDCLIDTSQVETKVEDVILDTELKETMKQLLQISRNESQVHPLLQQVRIRGALFYGPPGTGKTHLTKAIAGESGMSLLVVNTGNLYSKWAGEADKSILAAFSLCRKLHPCILFIDEADSLFGQRRDNEMAWRRDCVTIFLQELDGIRSDKTSPFVIAATNRIKDLDEAFMRRLPFKKAFSLPSEAERERILRLFLKDEDLDDPILFEQIVKKTQGFSGADLKSLCGQAALAWSMEQNNTTSNGEVTEAPVLKLTGRHFTKAMRQLRSMPISEAGKTNESLRHEGNHLVKTRPRT